MTDAEAILLVLNSFPGAKIEGSVPRTLRDEVYRLAVLQTVAARDAQPEPTCLAPRPERREDRLL